MNESDIRKYANLMGELGLTGLEITKDNMAVRLERAVPAEPVVIASTPASAPQWVPKEQEGNYVSVCSPVVGVFYAAPAENAEPFVKIGDRVEKGKTLCIIEAMKLMNEIVAEHDGVIQEICVTNGQMVDYDRELFRIKR